MCRRPTKDLIDGPGRAVCAVAGKRPAEAQKYFAELLAAYPKAPNVHYLYGTFLLPSDEEAGSARVSERAGAEPETGRSSGDIGTGIREARRF